MNIYNLGIDIGSTTLKWVLLDNDNHIIDKNYVRHCANHAKVFKNMGITAAALETGCFGSKEGCINSMKPENTMR